MRQRYMRGGLAGFHDYEVLELILSYSHVRRDTKPVAKRLIDRFGSVTAVISAPVSQLTEVDGVGERTALLLKLFRDTGEYHMRESILGRNAVAGSKEVYDYLMRFAKGRLIEEFKVIYLNAQNIILDEETLSKGTVNETKVYPRIICEHALIRHAAAVIVAHNHPGGSLKPSTGDIAITAQLQRALALLDIRLLDHIVVTGEGFFSFAAEKLL
ncbi:MAG: DNA repair protein RadC [Candidatus Cloacimonetes bacterium]|nr:DNA repair protein RadC [Candidatus Cloacimonadota bacterium]